MSVKRVSSGQPFRPRAEDWNAFAAAANSLRGPRTGLADARNQPDGGVYVWVKNTTGDDIDRYGILALGDPLIDPDDNLEEFKGRPAFEGVAPDADVHRELFCVLPAPLADGRIGLGLIAGITPVLIDVRLETDAYAGCKTDELGKLEGGDGFAKILSKETGTGDKWAIVLLGCAWNERRFELSEELSPGGSATALVRRWDGSALETTEEEFTVHDGGLGYEGGEEAFGTARWMPDARRWEATDMDCAET